MPKPSDDALAQGLGRRKTAEQIREELSDSPFAGPAAEAAGATMLPVNAIRPSPFQSRGALSDEHIEGLMASIAESGLLVPVLLRKVSESDTFELIAGHNRVEAFRRLGREHIPAIVRPMSDADAARALTVENTLHKNLTDWELFKHIGMLRKAKAVKNVTDLAAVLGCSRAQVYNLEAFGELPPAAALILDQEPALIGASLAYELKQFAAYKDIVAQAVDHLRNGKLKQAGVVGWIRQRAMPQDRTRPDIRHIGSGENAVKMVVAGNEAKVSGDINFNRLHALIEAHLSELIDPPKG